MIISFYSFPDTIFFIYFTLFYSKMFASVFIVTVILLDAAVAVPSSIDAVNDAVEEPISYVGTDRGKYFINTRI